MANFESAQGKNRRRAFALLVGMFVVVAIASAGVGAYLGVGAAPLTLLIIVVPVVSTWVSWWKSDKIVLAMTGARLVDTDDAPQLHNIVEEVCIAAGLPKPSVAIVNDPAPNAFATGRDPQHAVVAVTTGLLERMDRDELQGVIAHELAHVANRDTLVMSIAATTAGIVALLSDMALRISMFGAGRRSRDSNGGIQLIALLVVAVLAPIAAVLLKAALSRSREGLADATAVSFTRNPAGLRKALEKLAADSTVVRAHSNAVAHLWIECPLDTSKAVSKMFSTHPPIAERIAALRLMEGAAA